MRNDLAVAAGFAAFALVFVMFAAEASARTVAIGGTHSQNEIKQTCANAGGDFYQNSAKDGGGYGCYNDDKGTAVHCTVKGKCTGQVPNGSARTTGESGLGADDVPQALDKVLE